MKSIHRGAFHLRVGFQISFKVEKLMHALATMIGIDVNINAGASVSIQLPPAPYQKFWEEDTCNHDVCSLENCRVTYDFGGPLRKAETTKAHDETTWDSGLLNLA